MYMQTLASLRTPSPRHGGVSIIPSSLPYSSILAWRPLSWSLTRDTLHEMATCVVSERRSVGGVPSTPSPFLDCEACPVRLVASRLVASGVGLPGECKAGLALKE